MLIELFTGTLPAHQPRGWFIIPAGRVCALHIRSIAFGRMRATDRISIIHHHGVVELFFGFSRCSVLITGILLHIVRNSYAVHHPRSSAGNIGRLVGPPNTMASITTDTLLTGTVAAVATTVALAVLGRMECGAGAAPINAVSHMLWGEEARTDKVDLRHTLVGASLHASAVLGWAGFHELLLSRSRTPSFGRALLTGAATSLVAYVTDYHLVPRRLAPGFETRLSKRALLAVYVVLGLSLSAGSLYKNQLIDRHG